MSDQSETAGPRAHDAATTRLGFINRSIDRFASWRWAAATLFALSFLILLMLMDVRLGAYDEGIILTGAQHVLGGAVPHRDFYANYGPAQFYIVAALFDLFGTTATVARCYDILIRAAIVVVAFAILAPRCRPIVALGAAVICLGWMLGSRFYLYPVFPTLLLALVGTQLLSPGGRLGTLRLLGAGAATGLTALFRYDVGFFVMAAHLIFFVYLSVARDDFAGERTRTFVRNALLYGAGIAAAFLPPALILVSSGALAGFIHDIVEYPGTYYVAFRALPFPGPSALAAATGPAEAAVYLPFGAVLLAAWVLIRGRRSRPEGEALPIADSSFLVAFGLVTLLLSLKGMVRVTTIHMMIAIVPALLLIAFIIDRQAARRSVARILAVALGLLAAGTAAFQTAAIFYLFLNQPARSYVGSIAGIGDADSAGVAAASPSLATAHLPAEAACAVGIVAAHTEPGERIFVAAGRHDKLVANRIELYFAAARSAGTHWYHFDPGLQTRADVQSRIISDLRRNRVRWVIRDTSFDSLQEPNRSAVGSGVRLLDHYLAANYRPVAGFGTLSVSLARNQPVPAGIQQQRCQGAPAASGPP
jgi:hypothetical protein